MKKYINIVITFLIAITIIMLPISKVEAGNFTVSNSSVTLEIDKSATITINASTHTGRINITSSNASVATVNLESMWVENNSQPITISAKSAGNATITMTGSLYDTVIGKEETYTQTVVVTVNKVPEVKPEPQPEPKPEPEQPTINTQKELEFKSVNEIVYATGTVNVREKSTDTATKFGQLKEGDSVTRIGVSKTSDEQGRGWSKITYNGKTAYVISSKLTTKKPTEEPKVETPVQEPPVTTEEPTNNDSTTAVEGSLKSLEIEGVTLTPTFSSNVYEYRVIVKENISELKINAVAKSSDSKITIAGNKDIQEGENLIIIMVYNAKNEAEGTYQITVNKNTLDLTETDNILKIGNEKAKRNLILFITLFVVAIVSLAVVLILKNKHQNQDGEEQEFTEENPLIEQQENIEEKKENKEEKKKGKHF